MTDEERIAEMYRAFNARDADRLLGQMTPDVDWPNAWEGGRVRGREQVASYWQRQWAEIDPEVVPRAFHRREDGTLAVDVRQVVRSRDGALLSEGDVVHVYAFRDGLIERMDVEEAQAED
jgi:hypothetical protein